MHSEQFQLHAEIEERHWWFVARRTILRRLIAELVPPARDATLIDIGCGTGANLSALADAYRCVGVDTSPEAIELAQGRFPHVKFVAGAAPAAIAADLPQAKLVLLNDVLEHVEDDYGLLQSIVELARPGTFFLLTVPADPSLWSQHDESFGHFRRYDLEMFRQLWAGLPVEPRLCSHFNARLYPAVKLVRSLSQLRGHAAGESGTDFRLPPMWANRLCERIFAGEAAGLVHALRANGAVYSRGVSLIAVLERIG
ncbi:MAG TPA: class I SAM-dependent methyltransferase [Pirellulales bacterium]|jgi:SAM-dependent methyltransferase|nr:class I SAM-dependent methyltransferase [Pirellulales bacterium]